MSTIAKIDEAIPRQKTGVAKHPRRTHHEARKQPSTDELKRRGTEYAPAFEALIAQFDDQALVDKIGKGPFEE